MGRIDFAAIKAVVTMEDVLADYSIIPHRGWAVCPFHRDAHPSLKVYHDGYYCFACGEGGDIINFVARMEDVRNQQAAALIMARHGLQYGVADTAAQAQQRAGKQRQQEFESRRRSAEDILCAARRADGGKYSEWDYWLDYLMMDPDGFFDNNGEDVVRYAERVYRRGVDAAGDIRRDADDRGRDGTSDVSAGSQG